MVGPRVDGGHQTRPGHRTGPVERNERALQAMAEAVERSRRGGRPTVADVPPDPVGEPSIPDAVPGRDVERLLRVSVMVVAALVIAVFLALAGVYLAGGSSSPGGGRRGSASATGNAGGRTSHRGQASGSTSTTAAPGLAPAPPQTAPPQTAPSGPGPAIGAVKPSGGTAGQQVALSGSGFFSPDGHIQVLFDGQEASSDCPTQTACTAAVPDLPGPARTVDVTVVTAAGTSSPVPFSYAGAPASPSSLAFASGPPPGGAGGGRHHHGRGGGGN